MSCLTLQKCLSVQCAYSSAFVYNSLTTHRHVAEGFFFFFAEDRGPSETLSVFVCRTHYSPYTHKKKQKKNNMKVRRTYRQVDTISDHTYTEPHTDMLEDPAYVNIYWTVS